jgi:hypothetical protein
VRTVRNIYYALAIAVCLVIGLLWAASQIKSGEIRSYLPLIPFAFGALLWGFLYKRGGTARKASFVVAFVLIVAVVAALYILLRGAMAS